MQPKLTSQHIATKPDFRENITPILRVSQIGFFPLVQSGVPNYRATLYPNQSSRTPRLSAIDLAASSISKLDFLASLNGLSNFVESLSRTQSIKFCTLIASADWLDIDW